MKVKADRDNGRVIFGPVTDTGEYLFWSDWQDAATLFNPEKNQPIKTKYTITRKGTDGFQPSVSENGLYYFDYCVEQGETYTYLIMEQANITKAPPPSNPELFAQIVKIEMDFEDMFLSDGERQLKIQFNPQVSSFKNVVLEQKIDTIGGQYPFFFRNGNTKYKEFQVQGLISCQIDGIELFKNKNEVYYEIEEMRAGPGEYEAGISRAAATSRNERILKNEVLDWLNNGKPKLFRSPTEGNFIVRLTNVSLAPFQGTNRLVHTFSCTAIEVAEYNFESLKKFELI